MAPILESFISNGLMSSTFGEEGLLVPIAPPRPTITSVQNAAPLSSDLMSADTKGSISTLRPKPNNSGPDPYDSLDAFFAELGRGKPKQALN